MRSLLPKNYESTESERERKKYRPNKEFMRKKELEIMTENDFDKKLESKLK